MLTDMVDSCIVFSFPRFAQEREVSLYQTQYVLLKSRKIKNMLVDAADSVAAGTM